MMLRKLLLASVAFATLTGTAVAADMNAGLNRAELLQLVMQDAGLVGGGTNCFKDVTTQWFANAVCAGKSRGIVTGYADGRFRPETMVTFAEAAAISLRAHGIAVRYDPVWYKPYVEKLAEYGAFPKSVTNISYGVNRTQLAEMLAELRNGTGSNGSDDDDSSSSSSSGDDLVITITQDDNSPDAGDTLTYSIKITNNDNDDQTVDVTAFLDDDMEFESASDDGDEDGDEVQWDNIDIDGDDSQTLKLEVNLDDNLDDGDTLKLRVEAEDATKTRTTEIGGSSNDNNDDNDLTLTIKQSDSSVAPGDTVSYTIEIENNGTSDETVDVTAFLDDDMEFVSASDDGDEDGDEVQWDNIDVNEDETETLTLRVRIPTSADDGDTVKLRVEANDEEKSKTTSIDDEDSNNDDDGDEDVSITITDSDDTVEEGDTLSYTIRLENNSNDDQRVDVRAFLDENMTFVSATDSGDEDSDEVEWNDILVREDQTKSLTLKVRVDNDVEDGDTLVLLVETDDDDDSEETEVVGDNTNDNNDGDAEDVTVSLTDSSDPVQQGDTVTYRIKLTNTGNDDVRVDITASLDDGMSYVSATDSGDLEGNDEVQWENVLVQEDDTRTVLLTVRFNQTVDEGDTLRLKVEVNDGDEDTETTEVDDD